MGCIMRQTGFALQVGKIASRQSGCHRARTLAVAEHLSFRDAAAALGVGQSAVSPPNSHARRPAWGFGCSSVVAPAFVSPTPVRNICRRVREAFRQFRWAAELAAAAGKGATGSLGIAFVSSIGKGFLHDLGYSLLRTSIARSRSAFAKRPCTSCFRWCGAAR